MTPTAKIFFLALAGAIGTLARFGTNYLVDRHTGVLFPWGTFVINMIGCFLFGLVYSWAEQRTQWGGDVRLLALTGFMGAYTTFSSFAFQTADLIRASQWLPALANVAGQNILGIACVFAGLALGKLF